MVRNNPRNRESSYWCFTINNPSAEDITDCDFESWPTVPTFAVYNLETGEDGTPHYQGYVELPHHKPLQWMKSRLRRAHLEARKGNRQQAILYCLKDCSQDQSNSTHGENSGTTTTDEDLFQTLSNLMFPVLFPSTQNWSALKQDCENSLRVKMGRKEALIKMKALIEDGKTDQDLANFHFPTWIMSYRHLMHYRLLVTPPRDFKPNIYVCQGPTGTGKSKWALDNYPNAYWKQRSNWWDGYTNQETVIIDEFYGWLPFDLCLRLCDRYPLHVETKGGNVNFVAKNIIFTTNNLPSSWWKCDVYFPSFTRRVDEWHIFPVWGMHVFYNTYEEALPHFFGNLGV